MDALARIRPPAWQELTINAEVCARQTRGVQKSNARRMQGQLDLVRLKCAFLYPTQLYLGSGIVLRACAAAGWSTVDGDKRNGAPAEDAAKVGGERVGRWLRESE